MVEMRIGNSYNGYTFLKFIPKTTKTGRKERHGLFSCDVCKYEFKSLLYRVNKGSSDPCKKTHKGGKKTKTQIQAERKLAKAQLAAKGIKENDISPFSHTAKRKAHKQAHTALEDIKRARQGKRFELIRIDKNTWKEVEITK